MARMVTADDKSPLIVVIAWFLMVAMIVSVLTRLLIRKILTRALGSDDVTVVAAMVGEPSHFDSPAANNLFMAW